MSGCGAVVVRVDRSTLARELPLVLVVVAIQAQQLPVAAVERIVVVIVVAVMHRQFMQIPALEIAAAAPANMRIQFERPFTVALSAKLAATPRCFHDLIQFVFGRCYGPDSMRCGELRKR